MNRISGNGIIAVCACTLLLGLSACTRTAVIPVSANTFEITASAAPVCGAAGAESVASRDAAIATIQNGFDSFVILAGDAQDNVGVIGYTPVTATTTGSVTTYGSPGASTAYGSTTTTYTGGYPIIAGHHDQALVVRMFHANDPGAADAVPARRFLGPDWENIVAKGFPSTCW